MRSNSHPIRRAAVAVAARVAVVAGEATAAARERDRASLPPANRHPKDNLPRVRPRLHPHSRGNRLGRHR